jgi:hypothetical protein
MDTDDIVDTTTAGETLNINVVALTPADMVPAQAELMDWCDRKIRALSDEGGELELHQKLAVENGWKTSVVVASINRNARRITYYQKMQAALRAGYLLVPNMPVDVLAVRVKGKRAHAQTDTGWHRFSSRPELLPVGEGRYVDESPLETEEPEEYKNHEGKTQTRMRYRAAEHDDEVDFPLLMTKPIVLEAVARAMALKVFDQIGRVQNSGGHDPIYVGQLLDPRHGRRLTTFFLAWWVDTSTL